MALIGISGKIGSGKDTVGKIIQYLTLPDEFAKTNKDIIADMQYKWYCANKSKFHIKKFADKLKDIVCLLIGCTREQLEDHEFKNKELGEEWWYWKVYSSINQDKFELVPYNGETGFYKRKDNYQGHLLVKLTPRLLLQLLGTECGRQIIHPNIWVNALFAQYDFETIKVAFHKGDYMGKCQKCTAFMSGVDKRQTRCEECCKELIYPNWIITDMRFTNEMQAVINRKGITIRVERPPQVLLDPRTQHESETALDDAEFDYTIYNDSSIEELVEKVKEVLIKEKLLCL